MNAMNDVQAAPHSVELEQQFLGAVLADNSRFHTVSGIVKPEHFYDPVHAKIWDHISGRVSKDHIASPATLKADLEGSDGLKELGGVEYLTRLVGASISGFAVADYGREIAELALRRSIVSGLDGVISNLSQGQDSGQAVADLELLLAEQDSNAFEPRTMSLLKAQTHSLQAMIDAHQNGEFGVPSGLRTLDEAISFGRKRYTVLAGATSMGKTSFGTFIALSAAKAGYGVGFVTLEMGEEDLANRINSIDSQIPYKAYDRRMSESLLKKVHETGQAQADLPFEIFSPKVRDIPSILSEGKRLKNKWPAQEGFHGFSLLVIDYIQLVRGKGSKEFHALSKVANDLKQVAKQLDVHILALAQIDRKLGERDDPTPRLSDLRGSGDLEMAPDNVMFVYRPEYYLERKALNEKDVEARVDLEAALSGVKGKADIIIAKARMSDLQTVRVGCDMATGNFHDLAINGEIEF
jgi:replicative DNA helicase